MSDKTTADFRRHLHTLPEGMPISSGMCRQWGVSRQLAHWYTQNGWLTRLGHGFYLRSGDVPTVTGSVAALESHGLMIHIAGVTALELRGYSHFIPMGLRPLFIYARKLRALPPWFEKAFRVELLTARLFDEEDQLEDRLGVTRLHPEDSNSPYVSCPERATLEMLHAVPQTQTLDQAKVIMEGMYSLNTDTMTTLLFKCTRVKVTRLFLRTAKELGLPVIDKLQRCNICE